MIKSANSNNTASNYRLFPGVRHYSKQLKQVAQGHMAVKGVGDVWSLAIWPQTWVTGKYTFYCYLL